MRAFLLLLFMNASFGFCQSLTGPERINPSMEEISRCVPEPMQEPINQAIMDLPKAGKIVEALYGAITGSFSHNCKLLAQYLNALDIDELLDLDNIISKFNDDDKQVIAAMLKDQNIGLRNFLYVTMINSLSTITEDLRVTYLSLLDKGDCNGDQIAHAMGLTQKKIEAIKSEG